MSVSSVPPPPARPAATPPQLRAGVRVLNRPGSFGSRDLLQVGLTPGHRVLVPDDAEHRAALASLAAGPSTAEVDVATEASGGSLLARLGAAGLLRPPPVGRIRLAVAGETRLAAIAFQELLRLGFRCTGRPDREHLTVVLSQGEPDREAADRRLFDDLVTLYVALIDGRVRVGPFVLPGVSACLRCLDAHLTEPDPWHPFAVQQYARPGAAAEATPILLTLALTVAGVEARRWATGAEPSTWSATLWLDEHDQPQWQRWRRHPYCGCSWSGSAADPEVAYQ